MKRLGADPDAVEYLVGHSLGLRGVYIDPEALPLRATVDLIPPVTIEPRFDGLDQNDPRPIREITLGRDEIAETPSRIFGKQADRVCPPRVPRRTRRRGNVVFPAIWNRNGGGGGNRKRRSVIRKPQWLRCFARDYARFDVVFIDCGCGCFAAVCGALGTSCPEDLAAGNRTATP